MAGKTIANLAVSLTARIGNFEKGFQRAQKVVGRFSRDMGRTVGTAAKYGAAIVASAAAATAYLTKQQMEAIDTNAKLARTLGLSNKQLAGYQHAADLAGVSQEQFNTAMGKFTKEGNFPSLEAAAEAYNKLGTAQERAEFIQKNFGRGAMQMANVLEGGADGLREAQREAEKLGLTVSRFDATKVEMANDAWTRFRALITGIGRRLAVLVAPFLKYVSDLLVEAGTSGDGMGARVTNAFNYMLEAVGKFLDSLELLKAGFFGFAGFVGKVFAGILNGIQSLFDKMNEWGEWLNKIIETLSGGRLRLRFTSALGEIGKSLAAGAEENLQKSQDAFNKFYSGENANKAKVFFKGIQDAADKAARLEMGKTPLLDDEGFGSKQFGQQIDIKNVALGAASSRANDTDRIVKKQDEQIKWLRVIARSYNAAPVIV